MTIPRTDIPRPARSEALDGPALPLGVLRAQAYEGLPRRAYGIAWSADGAFLAAAGGYSYFTKGGGAVEVVVWSLSTGEQIGLVHPGDVSNVLGLAWHPIRPVLATGRESGQVQIWDWAGGKSHESSFSVSQRDRNEGKVQVRGVAWSPDGSVLAVTKMAPYSKSSIGIWDARTQTLRSEAQFRGKFEAPRWSPDGRIIVIPTGSGACSVHVGSDLSLLRELRGHNLPVNFADISPDGRFAASASLDRTVRIWDLVTGQEIIVLETLNEPPGCVQFSPNGALLALMAEHKAEIWRCRDWERVAEIPLYDATGIGGLAFHPSLPLLAIKDCGTQQISCYDIDYALLDGASISPNSRRYINAKVVLLGDTGVGKSGLGLVLSGQEYKPTDSSHGRQVWTFDSKEVDVPAGGEQTREVLLWDLAGQPGYRLVHQLHLNEIAVALLVFDSRSETDPFSGVKHWVRALAQARRLEETVVPLRTYLVAARADRGECRCPGSGSRQ